MAAAADVCTGAASLDKVRVVVVVDAAVSTIIRDSPTAAQCVFIRIAFVLREVAIAGEAMRMDVRWYCRLCNCFSG